MARYSTFDHEWVKHQIEDTTVEEVLIKNWPGLHIEPLQAPENMEVLIGCILATGVITTLC